MNKVEQVLLEELRDVVDTKKIQAAYDNIFNSSEYLVLYGCGEVGTTLFDDCHASGIKVDFFCESEGGKNIGRNLYGVKCISFKELLAFRDNVSVIVANGDARNVCQNLRSNGFTNIHFVSHFHVRMFNDIKNATFSDFELKVKQLHSILFDYMSFVVAMTVLIETYKFDFDYERIAGLCSQNQYFPKDIIRLTDSESFVDAGAFDGDTINIFMQKVKTWRGIYAFELSENNYNTLQEKISGLNGVKTYPFGLSDKQGEVQYSEKGNSSVVCLGDETKTGKLARLDDVLKNEPVTFIKMDIEGAEVSALKGAEKIIRTQKPKCAISVYHDPAHIFEVPFLLKQYVPEYRLFFRHHSQFPYETVCYAIL